MCSLSKVSRTDRNANAKSFRSSEKDNVLLDGFIINSVLGGLVVGFESGGREAGLGVCISVWRDEGI